MSGALKDYQGAVLMVSHNQAFLSGFCEELWVLDGGDVDVKHSDTANFDELLFSQYRNSILSASGVTSRTHARRVKANMAKRATKQRANDAHDVVPPLVDALN
jgi:ABC-type sulfate/molybdate transport systems ATPase subunit